MRVSVAPLQFLALLFVLLLCSTGLAQAASVPPNSWSQSFVSGYQPNVIKLWTTGSFSGITGNSSGSALPSGWTSSISSDGSFAQLQLDPAQPYGISDIAFTTWWNDPKSTIRLDWMELQIDHSTGTVINHWEGGIRIRKSGSIDTDQPFGKAGGDLSAVPEPSTYLMVALGLLCLAGIHHFRCQLLSA